LLDIAERAGIPFQEIHAAAQALMEHGLLKEVMKAGDVSGKGV